MVAFLFKNKSEKETDGIPKPRPVLSPALHLWTSQPDCYPYRPCAMPERWVVSNGIFSLA
jgi:hypothetical protein